ncbi:integrase [Intestinibaculum porci]|uniref:Integrase n=2 Tax=Intestinibaculum porci TaxID=2487118 RepID=A0A3G9JJV2_9FIRM|nr:integrase [Intestinibaculum porci]
MMKISDDSLKFWKISRDYLHSYISLVSGCSKETLRSYKTSMNNYIDFIEKTYGIKRTEMTFDIFSRDKFEEYIKWMKTDKQYSVDTVRLRISAIRSFLEYAGSVDIELMHYYVSVAKVKLPRKVKKPILYLTKEEMKAILSATDGDTKLHRRDRIIVILLYALGCRVSEITSLMLSSLHLNCNDPYVVVHGKGNKTRHVPIFDNTIDHLNEYIREYHPDNVEAPLFYSYYRGDKRELSDDTIERVLKRAADVARKECESIPMKIHVHLIRKTRAMHLFQQGIPLILISQMLGHEQVSTTTGFYAFATYDMMVNAVKKANSDLAEEPVKYNVKDIEEYLCTLD